MDRLRDMRENEHGRYTEVSDEKEVIRITAFVAESQLRLCITKRALQTRTSMRRAFLSPRFQTM